MWAGALPLPLDRAAVAVVVAVVARRRRRRRRWRARLAGGRVGGRAEWRMDEFYKVLQSFI